MPSWGSCPFICQLEAVLNPAYEQYVGYEGAASAIMAFHPLTIPGLLQTEDYARAILEADHAPDIDIRLDLRLDRQARLKQRDVRPFLRYVVDEAALHRRVGGQLVMRDQLVALKQATAHPAVSLQIVPFAAGAHPAMAGSFTIMEFGADDADVLYRENMQASITDRDDRTAVNSYRERFDELSNMSMPAAEAAGLIDTLITNLQDTALVREPR